MTQRQLESIRGDLRAYQQLKPGSMRHVDELMNERRTHPDKQVRQKLRNFWFYTADGELYRAKGKKRTPQWAITRLPHNLVLNHLDDAFSKLTGTGCNYYPDSQEAERAFRAKDTEVFDLTRLRLKKENDDYCFLPIDTQNYEKNLNAEEKRAAQRVFGKGKNFALNMKMLKDAKINEARIYVLSPQYVQEQAKESPLGRASRLDNFSYNSVFDADGRDVGNRYRIRGVRREEVARSAAAPGNVAVPPAPQEIDLAAHYQAILADREKAVIALDMKTAAGLSEIVSRYLVTRSK